ncbi:uncharacterized protein ACNS7B_021243 isoform 2-T2 [Menidia menidia]
MFEQLGLEDYSAVNIQVLGAEDTYGPRARNTGTREAVIWLAVHHRQKKALEIFSREVAPAGTGMAPGLTGIVGGRPRVSPVLKPFFFLLPKSQLKVDIHVGGGAGGVPPGGGAPPPRAGGGAPPPPPEEAPDADLPSGPHSYRLEELAFTRSGDKGDTANIGVIARHPALLPLPEEAPDPRPGGGILLPPHPAGAHARRHQVLSARRPRPQLRAAALPGGGRGGLPPQRPPGEGVRSDAAGPDAQRAPRPQVAGGLRGVPPDP